MVVLAGQKSFKMTPESFQNLIRKGSYQVFLLACPATFPYSIGIHPWFVCAKKGEVSRWEILWRENQCPTSWSHLHLNFLPPTKGIEILPFSRRYY